MTAPLVVALPGNEQIAERVAQILGSEIAQAEFRRFPDEESYVRFDTPVSGRSLAVMCTLDRPDTKFLPLVFATHAARELGATRIGLVAPYLAYMRQDRRFRPGEALTSAIFAEILSNAVDWLATVDPHLHRVHALESLYSVPAEVLYAAPLIAQWVEREVSRPLLIGPDEESAQWVDRVAGDAGTPHVVLKKTRKGDKEVEVSIPEVECWRDHTPVLIDDIISSARTMIETLKHLKRLGMKPATCIGVHAVFAPGAFEALSVAGATRIVTVNTIPHASNAIDIASPIADAIRRMA